MPARAGAGAPTAHAAGRAAWRSRTRSSASGEEAPAVLVHCRISDEDKRLELRDLIRDARAEAVAE